MTYCLNSADLEDVLLLQSKNKTIDHELLKSLVDACSRWESNMQCMTFSFSRLLERRKDPSLEAQEMIKVFFSLPDKMFMDIQDCDENFIDYMLRHSHLGEQELEKSLQEVSTKLSEYSYGKKTLRD